MEDTQQQQQLVHQPTLSPDERPSSEALQQMLQPAIMPYMMPPPMYHPYPFMPAHQPLPAMLYPADQSAMYPTGPIPDQYGFCYLPASAYQQVPQSMAAMQQQQQQPQHPQQCGQPPVSGLKPPSATTSGAVQQPAAGYCGLVQPAPSCAGIPPPPPLHMTGYSNYAAYGSMPMSQQLPHQMMPCCCCVQMPFQQQQPPQENVQHQLQQLSASESSFIAQSQSYAELYCQQQELSETARPEANFEVGLHQQQLEQESPNPRFQKPQPSTMPMMPPHPANRRRNGYMHNILYKTELCRDVHDKGACPRGKTCQFAHSPSELHDPRKHPLYKTAFCFDYKNQGYCPRGPHCFHVHDISELKTPPIQPPFTPHQPQPQQQLSNFSGGRSNSHGTGGAPRGVRSGRMRRRQSQQSQHQQHLDEAPGPSGERHATPNEAPAGSPAAETPFNFLMKKLQQQHKEKAQGNESAAAARLIESKTRALGLNDSWTLEPVRVAQ